MNSTRIIPSAQGTTFIEIPKSCTIYELAGTTELHGKLEKRNGKLVPTEIWIHGQKWTYSNEKEDAYLSEAKGESWPPELKAKAEWLARKITEMAAREEASGKVEYL